VRLGAPDRRHPVGDQQINMRSAPVLGITVPASVLARSEDVVEGRVAADRRLTHRNEREQHASKENTKR